MLRNNAEKELLVQISSHPHPRTIRFVIPTGVKGVKSNLSIEPIHPWANFGETPKDSQLFRCQ